MKHNTQQHIPRLSTTVCCPLNCIPSKHANQSIYVHSDLLYSNTSVVVCYKDKRSRFRETSTTTFALQLSFCLQRCTPPQNLTNTAQQYLSVIHLFLRQPSGTHHLGYCQIVNWIICSTGEPANITLNIKK